jgi:hypothetical protein
MGLTRIRAEQISDIDYKQAVRVITVTNVTLSGGAPAEVDGVSLSAGNRILVTGQSTGSQNGLYVVQTVGSGSNGTWVRSSDGNQDGEIEAGMIVMVTEGTAYKDTQWKLITNDPIAIGTTPLVFEQNSAFAFGNIYAGSTSVLATSVGDSVTFANGTGIAVTANAETKTVTFSTVATDSIFATGGDMGTITEVVTASEDLGLITDVATVEYDLGLIVTSGVIQPDSLILPTKTVAELANLSANPAAQFVYCSDESGGAVPAFSDGTNWRRVTDRAIVT